VSATILQQVSIIKSLPINFNLMKQIKFITACMLIFLLTSCKKNECIEFSNSDYIVFGHFYGQCIGEHCVEIYKLQQDKLFEDSNDFYPLTINGFYTGNYVQLSQQKFAETKDLFQYFPADLLKETQTIFGMPDAGDWGGYYIEYYINGMRKYHFFDKMFSKVPAKYHQFLNKVNEKIQQLQ